MAIKKYTCPPQSAAGSGTFSDDLVGFQLVQGGGLTQGNFEFTESVTEKVNRTFTTGVFSNPINLQGLGIDTVEQSKAIFENNFKVYPNFDLSQITNFNLYGSMVKRISASVENIINYYPGAIESTVYAPDYTTGATALNIVYDSVQDVTTFELNIVKLRNPFGIDFTVNATRNLELREIPVSQLRNMTVEYAKYSLYINGEGYSLLRITPTQSLVSGILTLVVEGNPFNGNGVSYDSLVVRPNDFEVNKVFNEKLDQVENFLLNRNVTPKYSATFNIPMSSEDGTYYTGFKTVTWPINSIWNIDIITGSFTNYLSQLNEISVSFDGYKTDLISRFLTTGAFNEFDTTGQKVQKVLQVYGRSFDETKKFIDALAYVNSVNYNVGNDIPSQLLKNLAQTLGWKTNISPISNEELLSSVFGDKNAQKSAFSGINSVLTPDELNYQYYRNLVLNSAYLFKSKGTRKSIETLMSLIGAPEALVEFNEHVYLADQKINLKQFNSNFTSISGGTYVQDTPVLDSTYIFSIMGNTYTGFTTQNSLQDVNITRDEYPMDDFGYPSAPEDTETYFFQSGSGWFEQTPEHRAPEQVNLTTSVFTGANPSFQTSLKPYAYGQDYLDRFRKFPFMKLGYKLKINVDNNKSWTDKEVGLRSNLDGKYNARYYTTNDKLVLNVKNVDLFLNPGQGIAYDIWYMSRQYNYPIPNQGMNYIPSTTITLNLSATYEPGSVKATFNVTSNVSKDFDIRIDFKNTLGKVSGPDLEISTGVTISSGSFTGSTEIKVPDNFADLTLTSLFSNIVIGPNAITYGVAVNPVFLTVPSPTVLPTQFYNVIPKNIYPSKGGVDWTEINPQPKTQTFFEFAQTFWLNMINVRDRQFSGSKVGGYPTLGSIFWKYLESQNAIGVSNDNFSYQKMIEYVNGMGSYWVRLVEQMIPASTIWNTGVKYENSIFHRQKFVWRRQRGCEIVPVPCKPCTLTTSIFPIDCPVQSTECPVYPWDTSPRIQQYSGVLSYLLNQYLSENGFTLNDCVINSLNSSWFVDIRINDIMIIQIPFFTGVGLTIPNLSYPTTNTGWDIALETAFDELKVYGYDYNFTGNDTVIIFNNICSENDNGVNLKINVGINFNILCN
jgi:hypothetical protein